MRWGQYKDKVGGGGCGRESCGHAPCAVMALVHTQRIPEAQERLVKVLVGKVLVPRQLHAGQQRQC